jgi:hypothetical protein
MSYRIPVKLVNSVLTYVFDKAVYFINNVIIDGFTKLGSDAPAIKIKELTGTTANSQGADAIVAHGLTSSKIRWFGLKIEYQTNSGIPENHPVSGFQSAVLHDATNFYVTNISANSGSILSKPFIITIFYVE